MPSAAPTGRLAGRPGVDEPATQSVWIVLRLLGVTAPIVYLAWQRGGVDFTESAPVCAAVLVPAGLVCCVGPRFGIHATAPGPAVLIPLLPLLQLVPLGSLWSPLRAEFDARFAASGVEPWRAASIYPYATMRAGVALAGCCAVFLLARSCVARSSRIFWPVGAPLALLGAAEAVIGVQQYLRATAIDGVKQWVASGTLVNRGHYAGLLEACLGVSLGWGFALAGGASWQRLHRAAGVAAAWLKRAEVAEARGRNTEALEMAKLARSLEPHTLRIEWPLAQLHLRAGNFEEAASALGRVAEPIPAMRATIYEAAWRAGMPSALVVDRVVPHEAEAAGEFLCYLARRGEWTEIIPAYRALLLQDGGKPPATMLQYIASRLEQAGRDVEGRQFAAAVRQSQTRR